MVKYTAIIHSPLYLQQLNETQALDRRGALVPMKAELCVDSSTRGEVCEITRAREATPAHTDLGGTRPHSDGEGVNYVLQDPQRTEFIHGGQSELSS